MSSDGTPLALHDLGGSGPSRLYVHGTSFHAYVMAPLARAVGGHAYGLDLRGHGTAAPVADPATIWPMLGEDLAAAAAAVAAETGRTPVGVGHSAGATALLLAEAKHPGSFSALYCYEPIVFTDELRAELPLPRQLANAARRRAEFMSPTEALEYFSKRPPLAGLDTEALAAYVEHGLVPSANGGYRLACEPALEAAMYVAGYEADVAPILDRVGCRLRVAYGELSEGIGPVAARLVASLVPGAELLVIRGLTHLGPLEDPRRVAETIIRAIETTTA